MADLEDIDLAMKIHLCRWGEVAKKLRERKTPLPINLCQSLADYIDPDVKGKRGRPSCQYEIDIRDRALCAVYGQYLALIGRENGPINRDDAFWRVVEEMNTCESTLRNAIKRMPDVVRDNQDGTRNALNELK